MKSLDGAAASSVVALAVFYAGFAAGQRSAPSGVGAEAASRRVGDEQRHDDGEEDIGPRPLGSVQLEAEPSMKRECGCKQREQSYSEAENERGRKRCLGQTVVVHASITFPS
jgi:hypothetical protein